MLARSQVVNGGLRFDSGPLDDDDGMRVGGMVELDGPTPVEEEEDESSPPVKSEPPLFEGDFLIEDKPTANKMTATIANVIKAIHRHWRGVKS